MKQSGIYKIINKIDQTIYIGSSSDIKSRFANHKSSLRRNCHRNIYLQRAWNKYGENNFDFIIIQLCPKENLEKIEQNLLDNIKSVRHYNLNYGARISKHSKETLLKISSSNKGKKLGSANGSYKDVPTDIILKAKNVWEEAGQTQLFQFLKENGFGWGVTRRLIKIFQKDTDSFELQKRNKTKNFLKRLSIIPERQKGNKINKIFTFLHCSGIVEKCFPRELIKKYNLKDSIYNLIKGKQKIAYGWSIN